MDLKKIAKSLPYPLQKSIKYIYGAVPPRFRYGKVFWDTYNFLQESQWWSKEKLEEYQMEQLSKLLNHAYKNVPYYQRVFNERGLKPKDIQCLGDLRKLPYLTKEIVNNNLDYLIARNYSNSKLQYVTTGGSTGIPLGFYHEKGVSSAKELAFMLTQWNRVGFKFDSRCVVLRGNIVKSAAKGKFWEYDPTNKNLILSSYHLADENMSEYIKRIKGFKPDFIQAYPSVITILAKFMKEHNIEPFPSVIALLCGSESLYTWQRQLLEEVFQCRVYSWYGHSEQAVLAGECEKSTYYHIFPEYGFIELIDKNMDLITNEDGLGEIVATSFNAFICPLIRYRTMDSAMFTNTKCECGRNYPLIKKIEGRLQDFIVTKDKRYITLTALIFAQHFKSFFRIKEMQIIQEKVGEIKVKIIKSSQYSDKDEDEIISKMGKAVGYGLNIEFDYVDHITRTNRGKHRFLIQKIPIKFSD